MISTPVPTTLLHAAAELWQKNTLLTFSPAQTLEYIGSVSNATNEKLFAEIKKRLAKAPQQELLLTVTSAGGPTGAGMCFYDTMRHVLRPRLTTFGVGDVDSSGIIIFLSGERRLISARTTLLLHLAGRRFDPSVRYTAREMEALIREDKLKDLQYAGVVAERSHSLTPQEVLSMMERETVLTPQDMLALGLAHEVVA